jgi:hydroxypyruvate isomerase
MPKHDSRRSAIKSMMMGSLAVGAFSSFTEKKSPLGSETVNLKGNINHAVCRWCYNSIPLEEFCAGAKQIGIKAIDLVGPKDWPVLKKFGLHSSMCNGAEINLVDGSMHNSLRTIQK